jgi:hypothetical protein
MVSSYERALGNDLLADELACLSYWLIVDPEKKGHLSMEQLKYLLNVINNND